MITFEEAQLMHEGLSYDSILQPLARLTAPIGELASALDEAIALFSLRRVGVIVIPWEYAMPFQRQWENVPGIKSVSTEAWLWGSFITYRGIDCLATALLSEVVVSSVRDLRGMFEHERAVLIDIVAD